jgi:hypothetical protein
MAETTCSRVFFGCGDAAAGLMTLQKRFEMATAASTGRRPKMLLMTSMQIGYDPRFHVPCEMNAVCSVAFHFSEHKGHAAAFAGC